MPTLARLEKGGNNNYDKAFNAIKESHEPLWFYTPKNRVIMTGQSEQISSVLYSY